MTLKLIAERRLIFFSNLFMSSIGFLTFNTMPSHKKEVTIQLFQWEPLEVQPLVNSFVKVSKNFTDF